MPTCPGIPKYPRITEMAKKPSVRVVKPEKGIRDTPREGILPKNNLSSRQ